MSKKGFSRLISTPKSDWVRRIAYHEDDEKMLVSTNRGVDYYWNNVPKPVYTEIKAAAEKRERGSVGKLVNQLLIAEPTRTSEEVQY